MKIIVYFILFVIASNLYAYWEKVDNIPDEYANNVYLDVYFLPENPQLGWICGFQSKILYTTDGGESWEGTQLSQPGLQLEEVFFANESIGYTSGPDQLTNENIGYIFKSTDGGRTWFDISPADNNFTLWGNYFADENFGVVIGGGCYSPQSPSVMRSFYTTDGGMSWNESQVNITDNNVLQFSKFADPLIIDKNGLAYASSSGVIWRSTNGGRQWNIFSYTGGFDWHEELAYYNGSFLVPVSPTCHGSYDEPGELRMSTDNGASWRSFQTDNVMYGAYLLDELTGWGAGFDAGVYFTSDGGVTWSLDNCGIDPDADMDDIFFINDTTGFVVGDGVYRFLPDNPFKPKLLNDDFHYICEGDSVVLYLDKEYNIVKWSTGDTTQSITVYEEGEYFAYAGNNICESGYTNTVEVVFFPKPDVNITKSTDGILCDGDMLEILIDGDFVEFYWDDGSNFREALITGDTLIYFNYLSADGCWHRDSITAEFFPVDDISIQELSRKSICVGYNMDLYAQEGFISYSWYREPETESIGNQRKLNVTEEGFYYVVGVNQFGCISYSDTLFIEELELENALEFYISGEEDFEIDETVYSDLNCDNLIIYNNSDEDFYIDKLYTIRNIEFSIPKSQLPVIVPANDTVGITICYNPSDIEVQRDTIIISDICSDRVIPVSSEGIGTADTTEGLCEIDVKFELVDIVDKPFLDIRKPYPQPANQIMTVEYYSGSTDDNHVINYEIIDIYGLKLLYGEIIPDNITNLHKGSVANGKINLELSDFDSGVYFIKIRNNKIVKYQKIIVQK